MQFYSDPTRKNDTHSLPDVEVFHASYARCPQCNDLMDVSEGRKDDMFVCDGCDTNWHTSELDIETGFYYWFVSPGCMPDSDPIGLFATQEDAISSCRDTWEE